MEFSKQPMNKWRKPAALPEEFSWENMKDGIAMRMNRKKRKNRIIFIIFCFGFIGLISAALYYMNGDSTQPTSPVKTNESVDYALNNRKNELNKHEQPVEKKALPLSETQTKLISKNNSKEKLFSNLDLEKQIERIALTTISDNGKNNNSPGSNPEDIIVEGQNGNLVQIDEIKFSENSRDTDMSYFKNLENRVYFVCKSHPEDDLKPYFSPLQLEQNNNKKFYKYKTTTWQLDGGMAFWKTGQTSEFELISAEHNASISERTLPGFSVSMKYNRQIKNNFYASSGIDYQQLYSVFTYDGVKKSTINLDDIITKVEYNLLTGNETVTRGAAQVDHTIYRKLQNLNRISGFSIPVNIGYQHQYNKWRLNAEAGLIIHVFSFGKGKTLYDGEIVAYNGKIPGLQIYPKIGLNGRLGVSYNLTPQFQAGMNLNFNTYFRNWTDNQALMLKPRIFGIGLGLAYTY